MCKLHRRPLHNSLRLHPHVRRPCLSLRSACIPEQCFLRRCSPCRLWCYLRRTLVPARFPLRRLRRRSHSYRHPRQCLLSRVGRHHARRYRHGWMRSGCPREVSLRGSSMAEGVAGPEKFCSFLSFFSFGAPSQRPTACSRRRDLAVGVRKLSATPCPCWRTILSEMSLHAVLDGVLLPCAGFVQILSSRKAYAYGDSGGRRKSGLPAGVSFPAA